MPTELESFLIYDAIHGLLADDEFIAKFTGWKALCVDRKAALQVGNTPEQEQIDYTPAEDAAFDKGWESGLARGRRYAQEIETAAIIRAANECITGNGNDEEMNSYGKCFAKAILALIPQDGRTELESLLSQCRKEARKEALLEAAEVVKNTPVSVGYSADGAYESAEQTLEDAANELRRMAESDKTTMEGEK